MMIADNRGDIKKLWRMFSAVSGSRATGQSAGAGLYKAEDFAKFFNNMTAAAHDTKCAAPPEILLPLFSRHGVQLHRLKWRV